MTKKDSILSLSALLDPRWSSDVQVLSIDDIEKCDRGSCDIIIAENLEPAAVIEKVFTHKIHHLIQDSPTIAQEINTAALMCSASDTFFSFPLSSILYPTQAGEGEETKLCAISLNFSKSSERLGLIRKVREYLNALRCVESLTHEVELIVDELFTNAVFNAPVREQLGQHHPGIDRSNPYEMEQPNTARLFLGHTDERLVVGCEDPFGSLNVQFLISRINRCFSNGLSDSIRQGDGGAGIGSYMVYQNCANYYVAVKRSKKTVVCCEILLTPSIRKREAVRKGIHIIEI